MSKGRGNSKTPGKLVELINAAISAKSIRSVSKDTGIGMAAISRYAKGIGEPTQASLEKLAKYFGVAVAFLRDDECLTKTDHESMAAFIGHTLEDYKAGIITKTQAVRGLANIITALDNGNYVEARTCIHNYDDVQRWLSEADHA